MKEYNNNPNPSLKDASVHQLNAQNTVVTLQNISKNIQQYSLGMRETMKTLRESGVIPEMAAAIRDGSLTVRDTVKDINETTKELKKNGIIVDTANAVENTLKSVEESVTTAKEITADVGKASPQTTKVLQQGIETVKKETNQMTGKVVGNLKSKVGTR
ncbi:MAG: hypothetical protein ACRBB2_05910 [Nitrosopumilus sp.]